MKLTDLPKGRSAVVSELDFDATQAKLARRLILMGIRPGARLDMVGKAPFGDPYVVRLNNQGFGLRKELTELIEVTPCD